MRPIIWPYKMGSQSAKALARGLETIRVYPDRNYRPKEDHLIINWGNSSAPNWCGYADHVGAILLNKLANVASATNKITCLSILKDAGVNVPEFALSKQEATELGGRVFCRTRISGRGGAGIVIADTPDDLVEAKLYTKDIGNRREYRVHVFKGEVLDFIQKKRRSGAEDANMDVRSHDNGWVFCRSGVELPDAVRDSALASIAALGLDFGAVDCYYTSSENQNPQVAGVFEVNTAPGIEGTTLEKYIDKIKECISL